jgi:putative transposase
MLRPIGFYLGFERTLVIRLRLTFKYKILSTKAQSLFLEGQLREACSLYNAALEERIGAWKICRRSINFYDQDRQLKPMRAEGLTGIPNFGCSRDVLRRVDRAFDGFFRRVKAGAKPGYPRFKSFRRYDSLTFPDDGYGLLDGGKLRVQGGGTLRSTFTGQLRGRSRRSQSSAKRGDGVYVKDGQMPLDVTILCELRAERGNIVRQLAGGIAGGVS